MADVELIGLTRTEPLGIGYVRVVVQRVAVTSDRSWRNAVKAIAERIAATKLALAVSTPAPLAGDKTAVVDLRINTVQGGHTKTVGELVNALINILDSWGFNEARVRSVERITLAPSQVAAADRDRAQGAAEIQRQKEADNSPLGILLDRLRSLGTVVYWVVILLVVGAVAVLLWRLNSAAKVVAR